MVQEDSRQPRAVLGGMPTSDPTRRTRAGNRFFAILWLQSREGHHSDPGPYQLGCRVRGDQLIPSPRHPGILKTAVC